VLVELLIMHRGPEWLIIGARLARSDDITGDETEMLADRIDGRVGLKPG
jgi:hypothetical protein